jgi:8-oxo-dGTP diphosphatase
MHEHFMCASEFRARFRLWPVDRSVESARKRQARQAAAAQYARLVAELSKVQKVAGCGIAVMDDKVLLVRTGAQWLLPGGKVEHAEHPADTVVRELAEETGLEVSVDRLFEVVSTRGEGRGEDVHYVVLVYTVTVTGGALGNEIDGDTQEARWVPIAEWDGLPMLSTTQQTLRRFFNFQLGGGKVTPQIGPKQDENPSKPVGFAPQPGLRHNRGHDCDFGAAAAR